MSYSFKKLSEVALEQEATEANAIVEVGGEIKRMPMSAAAGGGGGDVPVFEVEDLTSDYVTVHGDDAEAIFDLLETGAYFVFKSSLYGSSSMFLYSIPAHWMLDTSKREFSVYTQNGNTISNVGPS